ncbi:MAG: phosphatidylserine/phosphatidylglycerophosphate/cardiolipin synthase family protein [Acetobacteraceae bacterium]|nr:phosphatidylserine/phosphatidylglycerophosphate/cardiolipin synthase family protein [Acetobacteraceae bacterium]
MADGIDITFLTQADDDATRTTQIQSVASKLAVFLGAAKATLDIAIYDFRLTGDAADTVVNALNAQAEAGIIVRLAYFKPKQHRTTAAQFAVHGQDPAPPPSHPFLGRLDPRIRQKGILEEIDTQKGITGTFDRSIEVEGIDGSGHLMHDKYIIRDANALTPTVWTGSTNFTDDAWGRQDNNIVIVQSADIAKLYATDFGEMWERESIGTTGRDDTGEAKVGDADVWASFAPGDGSRIDSMVSDLINGATKTVSIACMVISSGGILAALAGAIDRGLTVSGIYDGPEMSEVEKAWGRSGKSADKLALWEKVKAVLVAKHSTPYTEGGPHDFMHNKAVSVDQARTVTGSFNFSANATHNAENILWIEEADIAQRYASYVASLITKYGHANGGAQHVARRSRHT